MPDKTISESNQTITDPTISLSQFWENFKVVTQPYWYPTESGGRAFSEVIRSWGMLLLLILLIVAFVAVDGLGSFWNRYVLDIIIEERDLYKYYDTLLVSCLFIVSLTLLVGFSKFVRKRIALDWYKWLSNYILKQYLSNRAYYKLNFKSDFDNPDQRLAQEIQPITSGGLRFLATLLEKVLEMTTFILILSTISQQIAIYLIVYTIVGNLIAIYLTQELNKINNEELQFKADYNYCLTHVRNHSESIAFFQGEDQELKIIERRFNKVLDNAELKVDWERGQDIFNRAYQSAISIFSMFILTPLFIQDKIDYGEISQASMACLMFSNAVGILISEWGTSGKLSSYIERLAKFSDTLKSVIKQPEELSTITTIQDNRLSFEKVTLKTPNYDKIIVENLSLSVQPGQGLLIVGPSGRGKSSLLRAIAGLWDAGTGRLIRPSLEKMLFLPQRPYIILGTLREQLIYPQTNHPISNQELEIILRQVNLQHLLNRIDNFDVELPWENVLSLGEQQRLAFARILVTCPSFTILDEATSALDLINEENLYQQLQKTQTTFISVGHRESLFNYHQLVLELLEDYRWQLVPIEAYQKQKNDQIKINNHQNNELKRETSGENQSSTQLNNLIVKTPIKTATKPNSEPNAINISVEKEPENQSDESPPENSTPRETSIENESVEETPIQALSHYQIKALCEYALGTIRNKGRQGQSITTKDGYTYRYDKDPKVRKWVRD
ncbi:MAG: ABC transporter ATP-binding protein/permease [Symploca sp. SIO2E9]|nr:ABC transporter ATP-binding protein/permease [Symploca sp. SIO2E9]